ncbi:IS4 family transposase [Gloeothece verrucosa]|uniref:Putative transposase n=1 Tax=Gloeothece verrucosa (strain PCC 7822) TaxID=497965 RepID=E0UM56_GLOV7|nr:IS4 family transposase [Gloeothece verrucosa]ADN18036.1 putative transposase [Gloeothece verrucosa PCC 7822]
MNNWVTEELKTADLGDKRLNKRLSVIVEGLASKPDKTIPQTFENPSQAQAAYEFWSNPHVKASQIIAAHRDATLLRIKNHSIVLVIQDTTDLEFASLATRRGLGEISKQGAEGIKVHNVLAVTSEGIPLGLIKQKAWVRKKMRKGKTYEERKRKIEEKESYRWLESLKETQELVPAQTEVVTICDREGDIFELFAFPRREKSHLLIRAAQDRTVKSSKQPEEVQKLFSHLKSQQVKGEMVLDLQRTPRRKPRKAKIQVKYTTLQLTVPNNNPHLKYLEPVEVGAILAEEINPPPKEQKVSWLLLTTLPINNVSDAFNYLKWYSMRWLIERYHYVLKSGCKIEELQLETGERLLRALACYSIVAWRLLWLTYTSRLDPHQPATVALEEEEWQSLYCTINKKLELPQEIPTIYQCVRWIARLGGFLGRKGDGEPGVMTLWRGWQRLMDYAAMWKLMVAVLKELDSDKDKDMERVKGNCNKICD